MYYVTTRTYISSRLSPTGVGRAYEPPPVPTLVSSYNFAHKFRKLESCEPGFETKISAGDEVGQIKLPLIFHSFCSYLARHIQQRLYSRPRCLRLFGTQTRHCLVLGVPGHLLPDLYCRLLLPVSKKSFLK